MKVLLVEAGYKNKYPPMGLMKISTYHKMRGDEVVFVKGKVKEIAEQVWDRIYITTLFTFYFDITVDTIRYYKSSVERTSHIYIGGILASLMREKLIKATGIKKVLIGQLTNSKMIGFRDGLNIDDLPLDYDILDDIDYKYPAGDNYFSYTTRGCPNKCSFCAVPKLEPQFKTVNHIKAQIDYIDENFGKKRNLLLLDNNVLESPELQEIVNAIINAGFYNGATFVYPNNFRLYLKKAMHKPNDNKAFKKLKAYLYSSSDLIVNKKIKAEYELKLDDIFESNSPLKALEESEKEINNILEKYKDKRPKLRYVDFNQGIDARLLTDERMKIISQLPLRPLRIAFDNLAVRKKYEEAIRLAHAYGVTEMSNYILYNYDERPFELWQRLRINIDLNNELGVHIFSFPMKYMPIDRTDREYIGKHWIKKYLSAVTAILLVTKGVVAGGFDFFEKAFGRNEEEYFKILSLPREFIVYRFKYENLGITEQWEHAFCNLTEEEKNWLLDFIGGSVFSEIPEDRISNNIKIALSFYTNAYDLREVNLSEKETKYRLVFFNDNEMVRSVYVESQLIGNSIMQRLHNLEAFQKSLDTNFSQPYSIELEGWLDDEQRWSKC